MTARDDIRTLSEDDGHHGAFGRLTDRWFDRSGFVTLSERSPSSLERPDGQPLSAVNLKYPEPCPVDSTADMQIVHWLMNRKVDSGLLQDTVVRLITAIQAHMVEVGATRVWGVVADADVYLRATLDPLVAAGQITRIKTELDPTAYYIGNSLEVETSVKAQGR